MLWRADVDPVTMIGPPGPNAFVAIVPIHILLSAAALVATPKIVLVVFLVATGAAAFVGAARLASAALPIQGAWAPFGGLLYLGSPVFFNKLVAGHYFYLGAYALLPWGLYYLIHDSDFVWWRSGLRSGVVLALAGMQVQFLVFGPLLALGAGLVYGRLRSAALAACVVLVTALGQLTNFIAVNAPVTLSSLVTIPHWIMNNSSSLQEALRGIGYFPHYYEAVASGFQLQALWTIPLLAVIGAVGSKDRLRALCWLVLGLFGVVVMSGAKGPLALPIAAAFHWAPVSIFRELYHFGVIPALAFAVLGVAALNRAQESRWFYAVPTFLLAALAFVGCAPLFAHAYAAELPQYDFSATVRAVLDHVSPGGGRLLWLPAQQPIQVSGAVGGVDPMTWPDNRIQTLSEPLPSGTLAYAVAELQIDDRAAADALANVGVGYVAVRPRFASGAYDLLEPALRPLVSPALRHATTYYRLGAPFELVAQVADALLYRNTSYRGTHWGLQPHCSSAPGRFAFGEIDSRSPACWSDAAAVVPIAQPEDTDDPRSSWQPVERWSWAIPWIKEADGGWFTYSTGALRLGSMGSAPGYLFVALACTPGTIASLASMQGSRRILCDEGTRWTDTELNAALLPASLKISNGRALLSGAIVSAGVPQLRPAGPQADFVLASTLQSSPQWKLSGPSQASPVTMSGQTQGWLIPGADPTQRFDVLRRDELIRMLSLYLAALGWLVSVALVLSRGRR